MTKVSSVPKTASLPKHSRAEKEDDEEEEEEDDMASHSTEDPVCTGPGLPGVLRPRTLR